MNMLYLTVLFPILGFSLLAFSHSQWSKKITIILVIGSIGIPALTTFWIAANFFNWREAYSAPFTQTLWNWIVIDNLQIPFTLRVDTLSLTMLMIVTGVGFCIHLYSLWYMYDKEGYSRFFAYTNLFMASMSVLVLADNLLLMYIGWEGVGLCSYLLIGFYYSEKKNGIAAMKAFIITRIGDVLLMFAIFILYDHFGTLNFQDMVILLPQKISENSTSITCATLMLLGGAIGKSAQLPLHTWLADAMVGPTPVSALIHAATMVTAGVYLIARTNDLFLMSPEILYLVGIVGGITLLISGCAALTQFDIKKILAYSTMSQVGYMFLALGVQAWDAAIFHLTTHAFFKSLLFLSSASLIIACQNEQNIFKMGGLKQTMPLIYFFFVVGGASLSAFPLLTSGFYSKGEILFEAFSGGEYLLLMIGLLGGFLTPLYTFRMIFIIFHGKEITKIRSHYGISYHLPLIILMIFSTFIGAWLKPSMEGILPHHEYEYKVNARLALEIISSTITIASIYLAINLWFRKDRLLNKVHHTLIGRFFFFLWHHAWGFDWLYEKIFVKPYLVIAKCFAKDPVDTMMNFSENLVKLTGRSLTMSVNGQLRWYIASLGFGAIIVLSLFLFL